MSLGFFPRYASAVKLVVAASSVRGGKSPRHCQTKHKTGDKLKEDGRFVHCLLACLLVLGKQYACVRIVFIVRTHSNVFTTINVALKEDDCPNFTQSRASAQVPTCQSALRGTKCRPGTGGLPWVTVKARDGLAWATPAGPQAVAGHLVPSQFRRHDDKTRSRCAGQNLIWTPVSDKGQLGGPFVVPPNRGISTHPSSPLERKSQGGGRSRLKREAKQDGDFFDYEAYLGHGELSTPFLLVASQFAAVNIPRVLA